MGGGEGQVRSQGPQGRLLGFSQLFHDLLCWQYLSSPHSKEQGGCCLGLQVSEGRACYVFCWEVVTQKVDDS